MIAMDTTTMPWEERHMAALGKSNFRKLFFKTLTRAWRSGWYATPPAL